MEPLELLLVCVCVYEHACVCASVCVCARHDLCLRECNPLCILLLSSTDEQICSDSLGKKKYEREKERGKKTNMFPRPQLAHFYCP